jgi:hypothetical protein
MSLIEQVRGVFSKRQAQRVHDFEQLAATIAGGSEINPDDVIEILDEAGKTADELQQAVTYRAERLALRAKLDDLPRLQAEQAAVEKEYQAEQKRWSELEEEHAKIVNSTRSRWVPLTDAIKEAHSARNRLQQTYQGPLSQAIAKAEAKQAEITRHINVVEHTKQSHIANLRVPETPRQRIAKCDEKALKVAIADCDKEIDELKKQRQVFGQEQTQLEAQLLLP